MRAGACGLATLLSLWAYAALAAGLYECRDASGRSVFQDRPCARGLEARTLRASPAAPDPEPEAAALTPAPALPGLPALVPHGERYVVAPADSDDPAWRAAFEHARARRGVAKGDAGVSLLRVFVVGARLGDDIQAAGAKLDGPEDGGGGRYRELPSGGFLLVEHLARARSQGHDEVALGSLLHGVTRLQLPVAAPGTVAAFGNVVLARTAVEELGRLEIRVSGGAPDTRVVIGPLVVGGPYGRTLRCDAQGLCDPGPLAPGPYELVLPDYDPRKSRFTTSVAPGSLTRLELSVRGPDEVVMAGEERAGL